MAARIWSRIAWSVAGLAIYAPIPLFAAFPQLAPAALQGSFQGVPLGVCLVAGVIVAIILLTWACGAGSEGGDEGVQKRGGAA